MKFKIIKLTNEHINKIKILYSYLYKAYIL